MSKVMALYLNSRLKYHYGFSSSITKVTKVLKRDRLSDAVEKLLRWMADVKAYFANTILVLIVNTFIYTPFTLLSILCAHHIQRDFIF